jgi:DNA-binding CsgD family transcriptional regulator
MTDIEPVLTAGQVDVLRLVADGRTYHEAATELGISESTAKRRCADAATRLGTHHITHTVAVALRRGLLEEEPPVSNQKLLQAAEIVIQTQFGSPSMLRRKLHVDVDESLQLMEQLEKRGVVAPAENGTHTRDVLLRPAELGNLLAALRGEA